MDVELSNEQLYWLLQLAVLGILFIVGLFYIARSSVSSSTSHLKFAPRKDGESDVIIVGSGILGSALAATLARDGRRVTVIERDLKEPDRIVGELLQPGGCRALKLLGLEHCTESIDAHLIKGYVIHDMCKESNVHISYPNESDVVCSGRAFHHGRFVSALRNAAKSETNVTYIEGTVGKLIESNGAIIGVEYKERDSGKTIEIHAPLTVVADGCFSRFRKGLVRAAPLTKSHFVGLILRDCPQMTANYAELVLTDTSPVLIYQISSTSTRVLVDIRDGLPDDIKAFLANDIQPKLPAHLQESFLDAVCNEPIRSMPNSFLPPAPVFKRGVLCLGDAVNMRHALTGGGMSVALNDVVLCRELLKNIPDLSDYVAVAKATRALFAQRKVNHSFVVNVMSMALYELFAANDVHLNLLKNTCFEYFQIGGQCVAGPVALLSVLNPRPYLLLGHFFAVAIYAMYRTMKGSSWYTVHRSLYKAVCIFYKAFCVIFPLIWSEVKTVFQY